MTSPLVRVAAFVLALTAAAGCAGGDDSHGSSDDAITAENANAQDHALKEHVLPDEAASPENAAALGIVKWNVYAGIDAKTGFKGSVFYASDDNGDVKYVFSIDVAKKAQALFRLDREGAPSLEKIDDATAKTLLDEVGRLQAKIDTARASACAKMLAWGAASIVLAGGVGAIIGAAVWFGGTVAAGTAALASIASATVGVSMEGVITAAVSLVSVGTGTAYVYYWVLPTYEAAKSDTLKCLDG
jgi:hypothetical protein